MHAERLVKILANNPNPDPSETELARALVMSDNPPRDLEAEAELSRALARNGGDGLTACGEDAGLCPKPRLRHRRVNVGVWPNWRCVYVEWAVIGSRLCRAQDFTGRYPFSTCGTYQDHLNHEELKRKTANYIQHCLNQEWDYNPYSTPPASVWSRGPIDAAAAFGVALDSMVRQARNISDSMGISIQWDREPSRPSWAQDGQERVWWDRNMGSLRSSGRPEIMNPPDTTWYAQYPEPEVKASGTPRTGPSWQSKIIPDH
jgi:hypothetical protein